MAPDVKIRRMVSTPSAMLFQPQMQQRALLACIAASIGLHAAALFSFPGLRPYAPASPKVLVATLSPVAAPAPAQASEPPAIAEPPRPKPKPRPAVAPKPQPQEVARTAPAPEPPTAPERNPGPEQTASAAPEAPAVSSSAEPSAAAPALAAVAEPLDPALLQKYRVGVATFAQQYKRYPAQAIERGWEGRVEIRITVRPTGAIESARIKTPSGYQILDDQALDMVRRALARTPVPPSLLGREFSIDIPVIFELQSG